MKRLRTIDDFLDNEQREFAMSIIENRAIPSVIDGFKPVQRKIMHIASRLWANGGKPMKVYQLGGQVSSLAMYVHGDASMNGSIIAMNQTFKNNLPLLDGVGQYGSLRVPCAGAPRYVGTILSENFRRVYMDTELLENMVEEGVKVEPRFFLPIIPMILVNGTSGIAVGYSTNILNRSALDVCEACIAYLGGKKFGELVPSVEGFGGTCARDADKPNKWRMRGAYVVGGNSVKVTELPPSLTFEKYEEYLNSLVAKKTILDYDNNSAGSVCYVLKFSGDVLKSYVESGTLDSLLKISSSETEIITTLDEKGKLKIFERAEDIVPYFCDFRLKWYTKRKALRMETLGKEIDTLSEKARFVKAIVERKLAVGNVPKREIVSALETMGFKKMQNSYEYLLSMPILSLTREKYDELTAARNKKESELEKLSASTEKEMYLADLKSLRSYLLKKDSPKPAKAV